MSFPGHSNDILAWAKEQDWYQPFAVTRQDSEYHGEIFLDAHVAMVMDEVLKLPVCEERKSKLALAAVFHDIAKPKCTIIEDGRIRSPGHGKLSAKMFLERTMQDLSPAARIELYHIIRLHGKPMHAFTGPNRPETALALWSQDADISLLLDFVECDIRGRTCADQANMLSELDLFNDHYVTSKVSRREVKRFS